MGYKITNTSARVDKAGKHNDRNFDLELSEHIDKSKVHLNKYYRYNNDESKTFEDLEKEFYEKHFSDALEKQNQKYREKRQYHYIKTIDDYYKNKRTKPEDVILQIGNFFDHVDGDSLWECAMEYAEKFNEQFGDNCKILDMALHLDEATPHVHIRRVWMAENELGDEVVSQKKALEAMGFVKKKEDAPDSQYNNRKIPFTKYDRKLFTDICKNKGIEINEEKNLKNQKHLTIPQFKIATIEELNERGELLERTIRNLEQEKEQLSLTVEQLRSEVNDQIDPILQMFYQNEFLRLFRVELEEIRKEEDKIKQIKALLELMAVKAEYVFRGDIELAAARLQAEAQMDSVYSFLSKYGLIDKFNEYRINQDKDKAAQKHINRHFKEKQ